MAVKGLEQTTTLLDHVKRLGGWVAIAIIVAAIFAGALILTGVIGFLPVPRVTLFGRITLPKSWVAFVAAFTVAMMVILAWVYLFKLIKNTYKKWKRKWLKLSDTPQNAVLALQAAILAGIAFWITHRLFFAFRLVTLILVPVAVFVVIFVVTGRLRDQGWTIMEWTRALYTSALIGAVVAVLSTLAFLGVTPGYTPAAVFLGAWAVGIYLFYRRRRRHMDDIITRILTKTGYAQMRVVETFSVSIFTGLGAAIIVAILVGFGGTTPDSMVQRIILSVLIVWPGVTLGTSIGWPSKDRSALVMDDINVRSSSGIHELTLRNMGDEPVDIYRAKIQDADDRLYYVGIKARLSAGESGKFEIPQDFELAARGQYELVSLPFGLTLMKDSSHPKIVTRDGKKFVLRWIDQVRQDQGAEAPAGTGAGAGTSATG